MSVISATPSPSGAASPSIDRQMDGQSEPEEAELQRAIGWLDLLDKRWFNCLFACVGAATACYCCCCCCWFCCNKFCCNFCCRTLAPTQRSTKYDKFFDQLNLKIKGGDEDNGGANHLQQPVLRQPRPAATAGSQLVELHPNNEAIADDDDSAFSAL
uniref:Uncharacterized protein n=1 Tax=Plectus sambesii TaxID=2011161 RepID=A0A914UQR6_9BILA